MAERTLPARVERRQCGQEDIAQIGERSFDLVGDVEAFAPQRPRLPQQGDLTVDRLIDQIAVGGFDPTDILE